MSVLSYSQITEVLNTMRTVCGNTLVKSPCYLTREQFIEAFIQPDHVDKLREVHDLIGSPGAGSRNIKVQTAITDADTPLVSYMSFLKNPGILVPDYIRASYDPTTDAGKVIMAWAAERREIGLLLGDAYSALSTLNEMCGNAKALALMFPALTPIMARVGTTNTGGGQINEDSPMAKRARAITKAKSVGSLPSLPREVIERIRSASAMVSAMIMAEEAVASIPKDATVVLVGVSVDPSDGNGTVGSLYRRPHPILRGTNHHNFI
jgi:hypothetical protein